MPSGKYTRTSEHNTGKYIRTLEHNKKLSIIKKEMYAKGEIKLPSRKGKLSPMKGVHFHTIESKEKNRLKHIGKIQSIETRIKRSEHMKGKNRKNHAHAICYNRILGEVKILEQQGFKCIPIGKVIPDIIALKDGKVYAVEVEYSRPNYDKYSDDIKSRFDEVIWIIKNDKYKKTGV